MGKCKTCGKNAEGDYCFQHKSRKQMTKKSFDEYSKRPIPKKSGTKIKYYNKTGIQALEITLMQEFFLAIWNKRPHKSEVSGEYLGKEPLSAYFHHILPKSKYPDLAYIEENIILLTLDEHANVESDIYKYEKINKIRTELTLKYLNHEETL